MFVGVLRQAAADKSCIPHASHSSLNTPCHTHNMNRQAGQTSVHYAPQVLHATGENDAQINSLKLLDTLSTWHQPSSPIGQCQAAERIPPSNHGLSTPYRQGGLQGTAASCTLPSVHAQRMPAGASAAKQPKPAMTG